MRINIEAPTVPVVPESYPSERQLRRELGAAIEAHSAAKARAQRAADMAARAEALMKEAEAELARLERTAAQAAHTATAKAAKQAAAIRAGGTPLRDSPATKLQGAVAMTKIWGVLPLLFIHSWYPEECCKDEHCYPVEWVQDLKHGGTVVKTADNIRITVPPVVRRQSSQDGRYHLCFNKEALRLYNTMQIFCFFVPGQV